MKLRMFEGVVSPAGGLGGFGFPGSGAGTGGGLGVEGVVPLP